jgi:small subunit ribosomal protein S14
MKVHIRKDQRNRIRFFKLESNRVIFLFFARNRTLLFSRRESLFRKKFSKVPFVTKIHNFCFLTGQPKVVFSKFKLSRISLKEMFNRGLFPGVRKSSWLDFNDLYILQYILLIYNVL